MLAMLTLVFCAGGYLNQVNSKAQAVTEHEVQTKIIEIEKEVYIPVEKIVEKEVYIPVEKVIEKEVYVEKVIVKSVEIPQPLRHFQDLDELERWLGNEVFKIQFNVANNETEKDCDDYAIELQERALRDGYLVSFEVIHPAEYNTLFKRNRLPNGTIHAINSVIIENEVHYIEPQNHEIAFAAYLD